MKIAQYTTKELEQYFLVLEKQAEGVCLERSKQIILAINTHDTLLEALKGLVDYKEYPNDCQCDDIIYEILLTGEELKKIKQTIQSADGSK